MTVYDLDGLPNKIFKLSCLVKMTARDNLESDDL
jgi:hypothetical protein